MFSKRQYKLFQIEDNGFKYKDELYGFDDIKHLNFSLIHTTHRVNLVKMGESDSSYLQIILNSGKKIKLSFDEYGMSMGFNRVSQTDIKNLTDLYMFLAKTTFQNRISKYINEISEKGYFLYDGCKFYPEERKIVFKNKEFFVAESSFLKGGGYIEMRKKNFRVIDKIAREVSLGKIPQFRTQTDPDVIFALLDHYFGLRWKT